MMLVGEATPARFCVVTELSDGGIRINTTGYTIPEEFGLRLARSAIPRRYQVIWRFGQDVGAKLIDLAPRRKPIVPKSAPINFPAFFRAKAQSAAAHSSRR